MNVDVEFERKKAAALVVLVDKGIFKKSHWPWQLRALWALGIKNKPPLFASFFSNAIFLGAQWGLMYGVFMWFLVWKSQGVPIEKVVGLSSLGGLLFGFSMAGVFYFQARKKQLPHWESL